jgi:drug/metabolite transporter (DMT)-like permease
MNAFLAVVTLVAFAANSLLCRMALAPDLIDPVAFTVIRLGSGVAVLLPLASSMSEPRREGRPAGSWRSGFALFVYAMAFSLAYDSLETGMGALILFGSVQATMIGAGLWQGERPRAREWVGLITAMAGLVYLVLPGITAPDPLGALLMVASGVGWGVYSLRGKGRTAPVAATAGNFARALPFAVAGLKSSSKAVSPAQSSTLSSPKICPVRGRYSCTSTGASKHRCEVLEVRSDKPITKLKTEVVRGDGTVVLEGEALCYTMALGQ